MNASAMSREQPHKMMLNLGASYHVNIPKNEGSSCSKKAGRKRFDGYSGLRRNFMEPNKEYKYTQPVYETVVMPMNIVSRKPSENKSTANEAAASESLVVPRNSTCDQPLSLSQAGNQTAIKDRSTIHSAAKRFSPSSSTFRANGLRNAPFDSMPIKNQFEVTVSFKQEAAVSNLPMPDSYQTQMPVMPPIGAPVKSIASVLRSFSLQNSNYGRATRPRVVSSAKPTTARQRFLMRDKDNLLMSQIYSTNSSEMQSLYNHYGNGVAQHCDVSQKNATKSTEDETAVKRSIENDHIDQSRDHDHMAESQSEKSLVGNHVDRAVTQIKEEQVSSKSAGCARIVQSATDRQFLLSQRRLSSFYSQRQCHTFAFAGMRARNVWGSNPPRLHTQRQLMSDALFVGSAKFRPSTTANRSPLNNHDMQLLGHSFKKEHTYSFIVVGHATGTGGNGGFGGNVATMTSSEQRQRLQNGCTGRDGCSKSDELADVFGFADNLPQYRVYFDMEVQTKQGDPDGMNNNNRPDFKSSARDDGDRATISGRPKTVPSHAANGYHSTRFPTQPTSLGKSNSSNATKQWYNHNNNTGRSTKTQGTSTKFVRSNGNGERQAGLPQFNETNWGITKSETRRNGTNFNNNLYLNGCSSDDKKQLSHSDEVDMKINNPDRTAVCDQSSYSNGRSDTDDHKGITCRTPEVMGVSVVELYNGVSERCSVKHDVLSARCDDACVPASKLYSNVHTPSNCFESSDNDCRTNDVIDHGLPQSPRQTSDDIRTDSLGSSLTAVTSVSPIPRPTATSCSDVLDEPITEAFEKDGNYFLHMVDAEAVRLTALKEEAEKDLSSGLLSEEASGIVRSAVGKATLLTGKKLQQFRDLCHQNLTQSETDTFRTTSQDLAGFWDLVLIQIDDVTRLFAEIDVLRKNNWKELTGTAENEPGTINTAVESVKPTNVANYLSSIATTTKPVAAPHTSSVKPYTATTGSTTMSRAKEEARKRLMAAKQAGRQRKASNSDDEIQIFIS